MIFFYSTTLTQHLFHAMGAIKDWKTYVVLTLVDFTSISAAEGLGSPNPGTYMVPYSMLYSVKDMIFLGKGKEKDILHDGEEA